MVAKAPTIPKRMKAAINPVLIRETIQKVENCMTRLQEIQFTVTSGRKIASGLKPSPRSTKGYIRTSLRCKQESWRTKNVASQRSPASKFQEKANEDWRKMSLPAMLLNETVAEILQASKIVSQLSITSTDIDPRTPDTCSRRKRLENTDLRERRAKEKQLLSRTQRLESGSPALRRTRSRIAFKTISPLNIREVSMNMTGTRPSVSVNRISPKNRPWMRKTVLFPNALYQSTTPTSTHTKSFCKTRSPIIARPSQTPQRKSFYKTRSPIIARPSQTPHKRRFYTTRSPIFSRPSQKPHKFLIKSQHATLNSQLKSKKAVPEVTISPVKTKGSTSKPRRFSFSPSKLANRLVSPLKARLSFHKGGGGF